MTHWFPTNKQILKVFVLTSLGWTILGVLHGILKTFESVLIGTGAGVFFTIIYIVQLWNSENIRKHLLKKYQNSDVFQTLGLRLKSETTIVGKLKNFSIGLTPIVDLTSTTRFNLEINLNNKPEINNQQNISRALGKLKYSLNGQTLSISNWSPKLWNYRHLEKVIGEIEELLNKLENC
ncbi:MAG: hypothetical protein RLQ12_15380 [Cyclobacteriaceae bacterium]